MTYDHKDFVQRESRQVLQRSGWVQISPTTWRRKTPEEIEAEKPAPPPPKKKFLERLMIKIGIWFLNK